MHIHWNERYEIYEAIHDDGWIELLEDQVEAERRAKENGIRISPFDAEKTM